MTPNELNLATIHPAVHPKYSANLHAFLTARNFLAMSFNTTMHRDAADILWLGYWSDGEFTGVRLHHILCHGRKAQVYTYLSMPGLTEIPDFWQKYVEQGCCAIDPEHRMSFMGPGTRWKITGEGSRTCTWCGRMHQRLVPLTAMVDRSVWRAAPAGKPTLVAA